MTSNQIDYYNARMKAKNDRLTRKETKRHNRAQEYAQGLSASAAIASANAAASQAATAQKKYQLEWETEYGFPYGTPREVVDDPSSWGTVETGQGAEHQWPRGHSVPQSYATKQYQIIKASEEALTEGAKRTGQYARAASDALKALKTGTDTFVIWTGGY